MSRAITEMPCRRTEGNRKGASVIFFMMVKYVEEENMTEGRPADMKTSIKNGKK